MEANELVRHNGAGTMDVNALAVFGSRRDRGRKFYFSTFSRAYEEARHQKETGARAMVGQDAGSDEWYCRAEDMPASRRD